MPEVSVILPHLAGGKWPAQQVPMLDECLERLGRSREILLLDASLADQADPTILGLRQDHPAVRAIRMEPPVNFSSMLWAAVRCAEGTDLIYIPPGSDQGPELLGPLLRELSQGDLVIPEVPRKPLPTVHARTWRDWLTRREEHDLARQVWGVRHEAVAQLPPVGGLGQHLPALVTMQGYRVTTCPGPVSGDSATTDPELVEQRRLIDQCGVWWLQKNWSRPHYRELERKGDLLPDLRVAFFENQHPQPQSQARQAG